MEQNELSSTMTKREMHEKGAAKTQWALLHFKESNLTNLVTLNLTLLFL